MPPVQIFQILNHYTSRDALDPGFEVLDNSGNERPDWYEYWPIRRFLQQQPLDEHAFYGFLSPKFKLKTNLSAAAARDIVGTAGAADVVLFSPSIHNSAYYWNVFEHGESEHPGLLQTAQALFDRLGRPTPLASLVSDSRNTVHSNYFVAKPRFWRAWLAINEAMFAIAESADDALGAQLRAATTYRGSVGVPMKIFIMERVASWLLVADGQFTACVRDPFVARARIYKLPVAIVCDALKIAYATQGRAQYREVFLLVRNLRKALNLQVRVGGALGLRRIGPCLRTLQSYWVSDAR